MVSPVCRWHRHGYCGSLMTQARARLSTAATGAGSRARGCTDDNRAHQNLRDSPSAGTLHLDGSYTTTVALFLMCWMHASVAVSCGALPAYLRMRLRAASTPPILSPRKTKNVRLSERLLLSCELRRSRVRTFIEVYTVEVLYRTWYRYVHCWRGSHYAAQK